MARANRRIKKGGAGGPFLDSALLCEQVICEHDGTYSAIRMINRITFHTEAPATGVMLMTPFWLLVSFKAGSFNGSQDLLIAIEDPSGRSYQPFHSLQIAFSGGDTGQVALCQLMLRYDIDGTYWIDILLNRKRFSRIPISIAFDGQTS